MVSWLALHLHAPWLSGRWVLEKAKCSGQCEPPRGQRDGHQKLLPTAVRVQFGGSGRMQNSLWGPIWDLLSLPSFRTPNLCWANTGAEFAPVSLWNGPEQAWRGWVSGSCRKTPWHPVESLWPLASSSETWKSPGKSFACLPYSAPPPPTLPRHTLLSWAIPLLTPHHSLLAPQKTLHQQAAHPTLAPNCEIVS